MSSPSPFLSLPLLSPLSLFSLVKKFGPFFFLSSHVCAGCLIWLLGEINGQEEKARGSKVETHWASICVHAAVINWNFRWSFVRSVDQKAIQPSISVSNQKILAGRPVRRCPFVCLLSTPCPAPLSPGCPAGWGPGPWKGGPGTYTAVLSG